MRTRTRESSRASAREASERDELGEPPGLLLPVGGLAAEVLDHPAGGIGLGGEGLGAGVVVIGFELFGQLANGGGELLGLDAQLPEGG